MTWNGFHLTIEWIECIANQKLLQTGTYRPSVESNRRTTALMTAGPEKKIVIQGKTPGSD
jgi:hypothetical protein